VAGNDDKSKLRQAYQAATQTVREAHRDEFNKAYQREAEARGVKWEPRKTQVEKDAEEFERLLSEHPEFLDRIRERSAGG
jgi:CTP synthase (UTP-ammonia lyase)